MFDPITDKLNLPQLEQRVLDFWEKHHTYQKSVHLRADAPDYTFYEGPPTANGMPGIHHVFSRTVKDLVCRYKTMRGFLVHRKAGWDTHGLPVEIEVEKRLGIKHKEEIETFGIDRFNAECRTSVFEHKEDWERLTRRMGYWIDMEHPYITCDNDYIESVWWALHRFHEGGLIYQDFKIQLYCPRCGTPLSSHEVSQGYREVEDPSVYIKAKLVGDARTYFLVWTTTPWTLVSNVALAVHPDVEYVKVRYGDEFLILARDSVAVVGEEPEIVVSFLGKDLVGKEYERWFGYFAVDRKAWYVAGADFVTTTDGSGIVHIAPAYGEDDYRASRTFDLPMIHALDARGCFREQAGPLAGQFFKDADQAITSDLESRGLLFRKEVYQHSYPHCWRCETPLVYYARKSWYIRTTGYSHKMLEFNDRIAWYPPEVGKGRFGNWLEENKDWAISRDRYWGTPIPIWVCGSCDQRRSIGSVGELRQLGKDVPSHLDLHRPYIDRVTLECSCGGTMRRIPEVVDVWFDSASMPFAQWHYPFENQEVFRQAFPADFIAEGVDQTRGWFYTLHAVSSYLFDGPCFENVIANELVLDKHGQKMSKSRGNTIDPFRVIDQYGADAVRWFLISTSPPWKPKLFDEDAIAEVQRKFFGTLVNTYWFFALYANVDAFDYSQPTIPVAQRPEIDRWILSLLNSTIAEYVKAMEAYDPTQATRGLTEFTVEELSNWYVRRNRKRFWKSEQGEDKLAAYQTLFECLVAITKMMAPVAPFLSDQIYRALMSETRREPYDSVHLSPMAESRPELIDGELELRMSLAQRVVVLVRSIRSKANLKVRQPLARIAIPASTDLQKQVLRIEDVILDEINVKRIEFMDETSAIIRKTAAPSFRQIGPKFGKLASAVGQRIRALSQDEIAHLERHGTLRTEVAGTTVALGVDDVAISTGSMHGWMVESADGLTVALDTALTPELRGEGLAREFVNRVQHLRKDAGLSVTDRIRIQFESSERLSEAVHAMADYVMAETLAVTIEPGKAETGRWIRLEIDREVCEIGISKVHGH